MQLLLFYHDSRADWNLMQQLYKRVYSHADMFIIYEIFRKCEHRRAIHFVQSMLHSVENSYWLVTVTGLSQADRYSSVKLLIFSTNIDTCTLSLAKIRIS